MKISKKNKHKAFLVIQILIVILWIVFGRFLSLVKIHNASPGISCLAKILDSNLEIKKMLNIPLTKDDTIGRNHLIRVSEDLIKEVNDCSKIQKDKDLVNLINRQDEIIHSLELPDEDKTFLIEHLFEEFSDEDKTFLIEHLFEKFSDEDETFRRGFCPKESNCPICEKWIKEGRYNEYDFGQLFNLNEEILYHLRTKIK